MVSRIEENDGIMTIHLEGRMDTSAANKMEAEIQTVYDSECKEIVIECDKLEYIASSGLRLFLNIVIDSQPKGKHLSVKGMSQQLRDVFEMTGFSNLFDFV